MVEGTELGAQGLTRSRLPVHDSMKESQNGYKVDIKCL